jgi:sugar lactone lactonase YvrE
MMKLKVDNLSSGPSRVFNTYFLKRNPQLFLFLVLLIFLPRFLNAQSLPVPRGTAGDLWADVILGQADNGILNSAFGDTTDNEATALSVFNMCGETVDPLNGILYVWDAGNNRILGLPINNLTSNPNQNEPGVTATIVLGQPDFFHTGCNRDSNWQNDPTPPSASASCLCGIPYFLQSPIEYGSHVNMAVDSQGNLYVPDYSNNRVLRFSAQVSGPVTSTSPASDVWGQPNFSDYALNDSGGNVSGSASNNNLYLANGKGILSSSYEAGVGVDSWGNLWVADDFNNRVLRFPSSSGTCCAAPNTTADVVLGQASFTANSQGNIIQPFAVRVDKAGNVYVDGFISSNIQTTGVFIFQPTSYTAGGVPVYGSGTVLTPNQAITMNLSSGNSGLEWDVNGAPTTGTSGALWVSQSNEIDLFQISLSSLNVITWNPTAIKVLLNDEPGSNNNDVTGDDVFNFYNPSGDNQTNSPLRPNVSGSVGVDGSGNVYWYNPTNNGNGGIFQFPAPIPTPQVGILHSAKVEVHKPYQYNFANYPGYHGLYNPNGVVVASFNGVTQVVESDDLLRFWDMPSDGPAGLQNGQRVDGLIGAYPPSQPVIGTGGQGFNRVTADKVGHLWTVSGTNILVYNLPLVGNESAALTISAPLPVLGAPSSVVVNWTIEQSGTGSLKGLAVDPDAKFLWFSDTGNNRVIRIRNPLGSNPVVDIILGQPNALTYGCNGNAAATILGPTQLELCSQPSPTQASFAAPGAVVLDHHGNLYVSDHSLEVAGNSRILRFDAPTIENTTNTALYGVLASAVYGAGDIHNFGVYGCFNPNPNAGVCGPWETAFNSDDSVMVVGQDGQINGGNTNVIVLANPLLGDFPVTYLNDFDPQAYSVAFDDQDNLYAADPNRSNILIYLKPFQTPYPTPTGTPSAANTICCQPLWEDQAGTTFTSSTYGLAYGPSASSGPGTLYVGGGASIVAVNPATGGQYGSLPQTAFTLSSVNAMAMGVSQNQYLYACDNNLVHKILVPAATSPATFSINGGDYGLGICVDGTHNDDLYVGGFSETVYKITQAGVTTALTLNGSYTMNSLGGVVLEGGGSAPLTLYLSDPADGYVLPFYQNPLGSTTFTYLSPPISMAGPANLLYPSEMTKDSAGNVYVAQNRSYAKFNSDFIYLATCSTLPTVYDDSSVAVDPQGSVYVGSGNDNGALIKLGCSLSPTPTPVLCSSVPTLPVTQGNGVALSSSGNVYVADDTYGQVDVFNDLGAPQPPLGLGTLVYPVGVAVDTAGYVYVTDDSQNQIYVFTNSGTPVTQWGYPSGNGIWNFDQPYGVAVTTGSGGTTVYVADQGNDRILEYLLSTTPSLTVSYLNQWGTPGISGDGTFSSPAGVALDTNSGHVFVADSDTGLVQVFSSTGTYLNIQWDVTLGTTLTTADFIAVGPGGLVYVSDGFGSVGIFDEAGDVLGFTQGGNTLFTDSQGVAAGSSTWYVADAINNLVYEFQVGGSCPPISPTPTATITPTNSPTITPTWTVTHTFTLTPTLVLTPTRTHTPTPTFSPSPTFTSTPTGSTTPTATFTITPTPVCCQGVTSLNGFEGSGGMVDDYGNNLLYVADFGDSQIQVFNSLTFAHVTNFKALAGSNSLINPIDVAVDGANYVYVADEGNQAVQKFSPASSGNTFICSIGNGEGLSIVGVWVNGSSVYASTLQNYVLEFTGSGSTYGSTPVTFGGPTTQLNNPDEMVQAGQWLYVADTFNDRIVKYNTLSPSSTPVVVQTGLLYPAGIRTDLNGYFYVTEGNNGNSPEYQDIYNPSFTTLVNQCSVSPSLGAWGVAVNTSGNVYVSGLNSLSVTVLQGCISQPAPTWTPSYTPTPPPGCCQGVTSLTGFEGSGGMLGDYSNNQLYVADFGNSQIQVFNSLNFAHITNFKALAGSSSLINPIDVAVDGDNNVYVADEGNLAVQKFSPASSGNTFICSIGNGEGLSIVGVWVNGTSVYASTLQNYVLEFTGSGSTYGSTPVTFGGPTTQLNNPDEMVQVGQSLYVADTFNDRIVKYNTLSPSATPVVVKTGLLYPAGIRTDQNDNFYVIEGNNGNSPEYEDMYSPNFSTLLNQCSVSPSLGAWGVAVNTSGNVYVSGLNSLSVTVLQGCSEPTEVPTPTSTPISGLLSCPVSNILQASQPWGVALGPQGNVYVADASENTIDNFSPAGNAQLPVINLGAPSLPVGVAVDGEGNIFVTDENLDQVDVYASNGTPITQWGSVGTSTSEFEAPYGIAVTGTSAGTTVYVADQGNQLIKEYFLNYSPLSVSLNLTWGGIGTNDIGTGFNSPAGVALDPSGDVYVADWDTGLVQVYNGSGAWLREWDVTTGTPLLAANFIAVANCLVYVSDGFGSVGVYDQYGNFIGVVQSTSTGSNFYDTEGIAVGNGVWYVGDSATGTFVEGNGVGQVNEFLACPSINCSVDYSPTYTYTQTYTQTPSPTFTNTVTPTSTKTNTPTHTFTKTPTSTDTPTPSGTPTDTRTPTNTPTITFTRTRTDTPTPSGTPTHTFTVTDTRTPTKTPTVTATRTKTDTPTSSGTPTHTFTVTDTRTPTRTPTHTATPTPTKTSAPGPEVIVSDDSKAVEGSRLTSTPTSTPTNTPTPTPGNALLSSVVAEPNISQNGEPIRFLVKLNQAGQIKLSVYSVASEEVYQTTMQGSAETNSLVWDLENQVDQKVASGLYIFVLQANEGSGVVSKIGKVVILH